MVMVFQHTDRIMIKLMLGETEAGYYSAALTCIGITSFVFAAIIDTARPVIIEEKERNVELYERRVAQLYCIITCLSLAQSVVMTVFSSFIVNILFGAAYAKTAGILAVAVWYITFGHYGSVRNVWILAEGKQKYLFGINICGALANVILNFVLIPICGALGAAVASLVTQFFTNVIIGFVFKPIRHNNYLMIKSFNPKILFGMIKNVVYKLK